MRDAQVTTRLFVPPPLIRTTDCLCCDESDALPPASRLPAVIGQPFSAIYDFVAPRIGAGARVVRGPTHAAHGLGVSKGGCDSQELADALRDYDDIVRRSRIQQLRQPARNPSHAQPEARTHMVLHLQPRRTAPARLEAPPWHDEWSLCTFLTRIDERRLRSRLRPKMASAAIAIGAEGRRRADHVERASLHRHLFYKGFDIDDAMQITRTVNDLPPR